MDLRSFRRGAAATAVAVPLGLWATVAEAGAVVQQQRFTFTAQGEQITCEIEHASDGQINAADRLLVYGSTDVVGGPATCQDSFVTLSFFLDDGSGDDLSQYAYGQGGYAAFSNHFPGSWEFHGSNHRVWFDACRCYAPEVSLQSK